MADTPSIDKPKRLPRKPGRTSKPAEATTNSRSLSRAVSPPPVTESRALTAPGGAAPPPRPPTGTSVMAPGASAPPPSTGGAASRSLALRQMELGSPRGMPGRTAGNLAALGAAGAGALYDNVRENYPRVQREELDNSAAEGISTRAFDAPARVPGRTPALVARRGGANGVPSRDPVAAGLDNGAELGPRGSHPLQDQPPAPRRPAPRPAPRPMRDERDNSADDLNRLELARIDRVGRGLEADRPPQFAKGGMVRKAAAPKYAQGGLLDRSAAKSRIADRRTGEMPMRDPKFAGSSASDMGDRLRLELDNAERSKSGGSPKYAKGGMVAKAGNPFAAASKAAKSPGKPASFSFPAPKKAPSANPFAAPSKVGKAGRPAGPPSAPPVAKAKAPKMPPMPFAKGGMPKKKGC